MKKIIIKGIIEYTDILIEDIYEKCNKPKIFNIRFDQFLDDEVREDFVSHLWDNIDFDTKIKAIDYIFGGN